MTQSLTLTEAKTHLVVAASDTSWDEYITGLIAATQEVFEHDTQSVTVQRSATELLPTFPLPTWRFYFDPVVAIDDITYYDTDNALQTLDPALYELDPFNRHIFLAVDAEYPATEARWDAVQIKYTAGQLIVTEIIKAALKLKLDFLFELRGTTKEKDAVGKAYEALVGRYQRSSYP